MLTSSQRTKQLVHRKHKYFEPSCHITFIASYYSTKKKNLGSSLSTAWMVSSYCCTSTVQAFISSSFSPPFCNVNRENLRGKWTAEFQIHALKMAKIFSGSNQPALYISLVCQGKLTWSQTGSCWATTLS